MVVDLFEKMVALFSISTLRLKKEFDYTPNEHAEYESPLDVFEVLSDILFLDTKKEQQPSK
jgi:hypothetical protein